MLSYVMSNLFILFLHTLQSIYNLHISLRDVEGWKWEDGRMVDWKEGYKPQRGERCIMLPN